MSNPQDPRGPGSLSLEPGRSTRDRADGTRKPDFDGVQGSVRSTEAMSGRPDFGNVQSAVSSTEAAVRDREYTVREGDTLSHIATAHYGRASEWPRIFEANRDRLDDPDRIQPGQVLRIPLAVREDDGSRTNPHGDPL